MGQTLYDYCIERGETSLLRQWHAAKNNPLTPDRVLTGSHKRVWWICGKGHIWQAMVKTRVEGCGCPVCANRAVQPGENDLASVRPDLLRQWDWEKNGTLTPQSLTAGSHRRVWWRCEKGHRWQAPAATRAAGAGCPVCAGKRVLPGENDLASRFPDLSAQWHREKNGALTPESVSPYSNRRVWWLCERGHTYAAAVAARTICGSGCPYCAGRRVLAGFNDLSTLAPETARQWHPTLKGALTPEMVTVGSHKKVWWRCSEGHVWKAVIYSRTGEKKCGCPVCAGRVRPAREQRYAAAAAKENDCQSI